MIPLLYTAPSVNLLTLLIVAALVAVAIYIFTRFH